MKVVWAALHPHLRLWLFSFDAKAIGTCVRVWSRIFTEFTQDIAICKLVAPVVADMQQHGPNPLENVAMGLCENGKHDELVREFNS